MTSKQMERWHDAWLTVPLTPQIFGAANGYCESIMAYSDENRRVLPQPSGELVPLVCGPPQGLCMMVIVARVGSSPTD